MVSDARTLVWYSVLNIGPPRGQNRSRLQGRFRQAGLTVRFLNGKFNGKLVKEVLRVATGGVGKKEETGREGASGNFSDRF